MKIATTQFSLKPLSHSEDFWKRVEAMCDIAHVEGADAICFPEYFALSYLLVLETNGIFAERIRRFTGHVNEFCSRMQTLAQQYDLAIIAGTVPVVEGGQLINRCHIIRPGFPAVHQDKIHMTRFEDEEWKVVTGGRRLLAFHWKNVLCSVAICYDVEFPQVSLALAEAGSQVVFVPSCTDTEHGYWRVRHTAAARAIENQIFIAMSSIVEGDSKYPEIDSHYGQGVILSPCDGSFPAHGTLALGRVGSEGVTTFAADMAHLNHIRQHGSVLNLRDARKGIQPLKVLIEA